MSESQVFFVSEILFLLFLALKSIRLDFERRGFLKVPGILTKVCMEHYGTNFGCFTNTEALRNPICFELQQEEVATVHEVVDELQSTLALKKLNIFGNGHV